MGPAMWTPTDQLIGYVCLSMSAMEINAETQITYYCSSRRLLGGKSTSLEGPVILVLSGCGFACSIRTLARTIL